MKAIIFDMAGVILDGSFHVFLQNASDILGLDFRDYADSIPDFKPDKDLILLLEDYFGKKMTNQQKEMILELWDQNWMLNGRVHKLTQKLKESYLVGLLTNAGPRYEKIAEEQGWFEHMDAVVFSHHVGKHKPDPGIYKHMAEVMEVPVNECLFIDDSRAYVEGARRAGMEALVFHDYFQLVDKLKEKGVNV
jgi:HAD superfamily hydrolase (TIGR01509 family)